MTLENLPPLYVGNPQYDDMGEILNRLGISYQSLSSSSLRDEKKGVVFLNCASRYQPPDRSLCSEVEGFVNRGGCVIASDWACGVLSKISEAEFVELPSVPVSLETKIVDDEFADILGRNRVDIRLHTGTLYKPTKLPRPNRVLLNATLSGTISKSISLLSDVFGGSDSYGTSTEVPLAYKYPFGKGSIVYTAFHNHEQPSGIEEALLRLLVMLPIAEATDSTVKDTYATITEKENKELTDSSVTESTDSKKASFVRCSECGTENDPSNTFCKNSNCGKKID